MNYSRLILASVGATAVYFILGGLMFTRPFFKDEFRKYPAVYRPEEGIKAVMPAGMAAMLLSIGVLAVIYSMLYRGGSGLAEGARFGALIGLFAVCAFVVHNYINLNIGWELTLKQATAYFIEWTFVGIVIGLIYRPLAEQ